MTDASSLPCPLQPSPIPFIDAPTARRVLTPHVAISALEDVLTSSFDIELDPVRHSLPTLDGRSELLSMPSAIPGWIGSKLLTISPDNPAQGRPRVQGLYVLFDAETSSPALLIDGAALTEIRTPAMTAVAVSHLAAADASALLVYGRGPQALAHVRTLAKIRPLSEVRLKARSSAAAEVAKLREEGYPVRELREGEDFAPDIIVCATSAATPVLSADAVPQHAVVAAIGSHSPAARELPSDLVSRAQVMIDSRATTLTEGGDVVIPIQEGAVLAEDFATVQQLVRGEVTRDFSRPAVFKGTGMSWQDLAVAAACAKGRS